MALTGNYETQKRREKYAAQDVQNGGNWLERLVLTPEAAKRRAEERLNQAVNKPLPIVPAAASPQDAAKASPLPEPEMIKARPVAAVPQGKVQSSPQQTMASRDGLPENAAGYNATGLAGNDLTNKNEPNWFDKFSDVLGKVKQAPYPETRAINPTTASAGNGGQGGSLSGAMSEEARARQAAPTYYDKFTALFR